MCSKMCENNAQHRHEIMRALLFEVRLLRVPIEDAILLDNILVVAHS